MRPGRNGHAAGAEWRGVGAVAEADQAQAAGRDVRSSLAAIEPGRGLWTRVDRVTALVIDALVDHLLESHSDSPARVCPHALPDAFQRSPRPLVLDVVRGVLACADTCYPLRAAQSRPREAVCFACAGPVGGVVRHNLFVAHGPVLAAAALCPTCCSRRRVPPPGVP